MEAAFFDDAIAHEAGAQISLVLRRFATPFLLAAFLDIVWIR